MPARPINFVLPLLLIVPPRGMSSSFTSSSVPLAEIVRFGSDTVPLETVKVPAIVSDPSPLIDPPCNATAKAVMF